MREDVLLPRRLPHLLLLGLLLHGLQLLLQHVLLHGLLHACVVSRRGVAACVTGALSHVAGSAA
jgi:hypothetical protein